MTKKGSVIPQYLIVTKREQRNFPCRLANKFADGNCNRKRNFGTLRDCLHGGGGLQIGEVTCGGSLHLSCKRDQIKMRDYMERRVTPTTRVTLPTWGPPPPCKKALIKRGGSSAPAL